MVVATVITDLVTIAVLISKALTESGISAIAMTDAVVDTVS
jgi:hypothetical protein